MKTRCSEAYWEEHQGYRGTKMCAEWKADMYEFYEWCNDAQFYRINGENTVHLDKDILGRVKGSDKIYSPDTCLFVPSKVNTFFGGSSGRDNGLPIGVEKIEESGKFKVSTKAFRIHDIFDTPEEAWECWRQHKEAQKIALADEYYSKRLIPRKVYDAMMQYDFRITD